jgi:hypothetical protein
MSRSSRCLIILTGAAALLAGCAFAPFGTRLRPTNVHVCVVSQSYVQGELEPCG